MKAEAFFFKRFKNICAGTQVKKSKKKISSSKDFFTFQT